MKKIILSAVLVALSLQAQTTTRWFATTGDQVLSAAGTSATIQQQASGSQAYIDKVVIYCTVACNITFANNGAAATTTAGTILPLAPAPTNTPILLNWYTSSNVGAGTSQGGIVHIPAGATVPVCFSPACGEALQYQFGPGSGTATNFTVTVSTITGTVNITVFGRSVL